MPAGTFLLDRLLSASSPVSANDSQAAGAVEVPSDYYVDHYNKANKTSYKNADEINTATGAQEDDAHFVPTSSRWINPKGEDVTEMVTNGGDSTLPYKKSSFWQRFANPEAAGIEDRTNAAYTSGLAQAANQNNIRNTIGGQNFAKVLNAQKTPINEQNPDDAFLSTEEMPAITGAEQNRSNLAGGVPISNTEKLLAGNKAETAESENSFANAKKRAALGNPELAANVEKKGGYASLARFGKEIALAPLEEKAEGATLNNTIANIKQLAQPQRDLTLAQTRLGKLQTQGDISRVPQTEALKNEQVKNALSEAQTLTPVEIKLRLTQAGLSQQEAEDTYNNYMQHTKAANKYKAALDEITSGGALGRAPLEEKVKDTEAKVALGKSGMSNWMYDKATKQLIGGGKEAPSKGITLASGRVVVPKPNIQGSVVQQPQNGKAAANLIKPTITNDVPPTDEVKEPDPEAVWSQDRQMSEDLAAKAGDNALSPFGYRGPKEVLQDEMAKAAGVPKGYVGSSNIEAAPRKVIAIMGGFSNPQFQKKLNSLTAQQQEQLWHTILSRIQENGR